LAWSVPPLNPLHVFEVAARVGSFTKAAEILSVSPSAVSRQIATLESFLDVRLFHRAREGNLLPEVGEEYSRGISPAFQIITSVTDRVARAQDNAPLNVRVPATFAVRFLIPRLSQFKEDHPDINVRIITGFGPVDFVREDVDISIQVGSGDWPGTESKPLFANWAQPMCNPKLFKDGKPIERIDDLRGHRLLISNNRRSDWSDWLTEMGRTDFPLHEMEMIEFPNSMLAYQAAADGLGVVIGQVPVLGPEFAAQTLVPLFGKPIRQGSYCAVWRAETGPSRKTRQFLFWLQRQLDPILARLPADPAAA
jgi:LysR family transcriptional regulator, glycine cleavage system transcriptional activator